MDSMLVPARATVEVAAICVERERWSVGDEATTIEAFAPPSVRSHAFVRDLVADGGTGEDSFARQQEAVWMVRLGCPPRFHA